MDGEPYRLKKGFKKRLKKLKRRKKTMKARM